MVKDEDKEVPINEIKFKRHKVSNYINKITSNINKLSCEDNENIIEYLILSRLKDQGRIE